MYRDDGSSSRPHPGYSAPTGRPKKGFLTNPPLWPALRQKRPATASERAARVMTADRGNASPGEASGGSTRFRGFPDTPESATVSAPDSQQPPLRDPSRDPVVASHNCDYIQIPDSGDATWAS